MKDKIKEIFDTIFNFDFWGPVILIVGLLLLCIGIPYIANKQEQNDYNVHSVYIGQTIKLNNDTVEILEWRTGRYEPTRGFVLNNGMTVDEIIVEKNLIKK